MTTPFEVPIEDWIDLHTFNPRDVPGVVQEYLFQVVQRRFPIVRIVHGRGIGVQREIVHSILRKHPDVLEFHDTADHGATVVSLRT